MDHQHHPTSDPARAAFTALLASVEHVLGTLTAAATLLDLDPPPPRSLAEGTADLQWWRFELDPAGYQPIGGAPR